MTKSEIFKAAHRMARGTVKAVGNYMIAFSLALKEVYNSTKKVAKSAEQQLIDLGGKLWEKGCMRRVYLSLDVLNSITGLGWYLNSSYNKFYFEDGGFYRKCTKRANKHKQYFIGNFNESGFTINK